MTAPLSETTSRSWEVHFGVMKTAPYLQKRFLYWNQIDFRRDCEIFDNTLFYLYNNFRTKSMLLNLESENL